MLVLVPVDSRKRTGSLTIVAAVEEQEMGCERRM